MKEEVYLLVVDEELSVKEKDQGIEYGDVFKFLEYVPNVNYDFVICQPVESKCKQVVVVFHVSQLRLLEDYDNYMERE